MDEAVQQFVEKMGLSCEKDGMPRSAGRIFGLLLATAETFSLEDIAERLQVSKASVSTNARMLEQIGFLERVSALGDRRDFYRLEADPWEKMLRAAEQRWRDQLGILAEAAASLPSEEGRSRAAQAERFHRLLLERSEELIAEWRAVRCAEAVEARGADETVAP